MWNNVTTIKIQFHRIEQLGSVQLDDKNRICKFTSFDGQLELQGRHGRCSVDIESPEFVRFVQFLVNKTEKSNEPIDQRRVFGEFRALELPPIGADSMELWPGI